MKKSIKIVAVLVILALVVGVSFLTFSSDSGGLGQGLAKKKKKSSSSPPPATPAANTQQITPLLTIESYDAGTGSYLFSDARLEWNNPDCNESYYRYIGYWKLRSNTDIAANGFTFWTSLGNQMQDYKVLVGTQGANSKNIANYDVTISTNQFSALSNSNFIIPANMDVFVTLLTKYYADDNVNGQVNRFSAMKSEGVLGEFIGNFGNYSPRVVLQHVQNNQANFAIGFTEFGPYDGLSCNR